MSEEETFPSLTVFEYFKTLFKLLRDKLMTNVEDKHTLDLKKLIWDGNRLSGEKTTDKGIQAVNLMRHNESQSPKSWVKGKPDSSHHLGLDSARKNKRQSASRNSVFSRLSRASKRGGSVNSGDGVNNKETQTGPELIEKYANLYNQN